MFIVPVADDRIETLDGLPFKVLSYTNYRDEGPAVIAEDKSSGVSQTIFFSNLKTLNDQPVKLSKGKATKVLEIDGYLPRSQPLPQPGDVITATVADSSDKYRVTGLKLHVRNRLSEGLIIKAEELELGTEVELSIDQIDDIERTLFNKKKFRLYYQDYAKKGMA